MTSNKKANREQVPNDAVFSKIRAEVLPKIRPSETERVKLEAVKAELLEAICKTAEKFHEDDIIPISVGSAERSTWLSGNHDIDLFVSYPEGVSREEMETRSRRLLMEVAKTGDSWEDRHSEHPYIHMTKSGFEVDLVPCFRVKSASDIKSAVDRTPFHCCFVKERISGKEDDVLLLKQFMKSTGVYGSEVRNGGFSGYLTELLVIWYGSFENVLQNAACWRFGQTIDIVGHQTLSHEDPLVVIDPTDPKRNVAAALSLTRFAQFINVAQRYMQSPNVDFFIKKEYAPLSVSEFKEIMKCRGTEWVGLVFDAPKKADDTLYPQLFRLENSLGEILAANDFAVMNTHSFAENKCLILFELMSKTLPPLQKRVGPPVWAADNAKSFYDKYKNAEETFSLKIKNEFLVAEIVRKYQTAESLIADKILKEAALGRHVRAAVSDGYEIIGLDEICEIKSPAFWKWMAEKLTKQI
ncbi:CCA tRNA nucleotidyltransferase [Methanolapillus millepedarum]|uniref:CCA-adding enzyme n=1 Tax=Methanolapillus millepedarum TaxID=3028296 RepID=A0AA96ZVY3_9EURY|nr:hypothetical protein MsAc7_15430 [Methanosarcinaceae archaeon Ac7]